MSAVSYPCLVMASVVFYVGLYHILMFFKRRASQEQLAFALLCFSVGFYDLFSIGLYNAVNVEQGIFWQRLQLMMAELISIFLLWFVHVFTKRKNKKVFQVLIIWFGFLLLLSFILGDTFTLSVDRPEIKHLSLFGLDPIIYYEGELGPLYIVGIVSSLTVYVYIMFLLLRYYRKSQDKNALYIISGQFVYFGGVINDSLVAGGVWTFLYVSEYTFLVVIAGMSYVILSEFIALHKAIEHMNKNLEKMVEVRTQEIQGLNESLRRQINLDGLTGIYNRRFFNEYLEIEVKRAKNQLEHRASPEDTANDMNFGLAIIDIDNFKKINDQYGHLAGDGVLMEVVNVIKGTIFGRDLLCRYGGEEFVIIFTRTSQGGILYAAEKIRTNVESHTFLYDSTEPLFRVSISIGVSFFSEVAHLEGREILKLADERLLLAKGTGKNKVVYKT